MTIVYDGDCGICSAGIAVLRARCARADVAFVASQSLAAREREAIEAQAGAGIFDRSVVLAADGRITTGARAVNAALALVFPRTAPLLAIVGGIAPLVAIEEAAYRLFARHRRALSRALGFTACATR